MAAPMENLFVREIELGDSKILKINQSEIGDVGCVVWDAAIVLTLYLKTDDFDSGNLWEGKNVLELGAGTGVVGLCAASLGANVTITDLPELIPLIQKNINDNMDIVTGAVKAEPLTWGKTNLHSTENFSTHPDYILLADCIYYEESLMPLVSTLNQLCDSDTVVLCCYEQRDTEIKKVLEANFFDLVNQYFKTEKIPLEHQDPEYRSEDIHIFKFMKKTKPDVT